jgi:hypothetical protein
MLFRTFEIFQNRVEYTRNADGSWKAEFHGAMDVAVEEPTLERVRCKVAEALDQKLAEWIVGPIKVDSLRRRRRRSA